MQQIMPHFSSHSIYHYDSVQCDINVFELIATADANLTVSPKKHQPSEENGLTLTLRGVCSPDVSDFDINGGTDEWQQSTGRRHEDKEGRSKRNRGQLNSILFAPLSPTRTLARKLHTSIRKLTGRQKSGHKRTPSNPQLVMDTIGIDNGHWDLKPSCSYESTVSIDLGSIDD